MVSWCRPRRRSILRRGRCAGWEAPWRARRRRDKLNRCLRRAKQDEKGAGQAVDGGPMMSRRATQWLVRCLVRCNAEARGFEAKILESELWRKKPWHSNTAKADSLATGLVLRGATATRSKPQVRWWPTLQLRVSFCTTWNSVQHLFFSFLSEEWVDCSLFGRCIYMVILQYNALFVSTLIGAVCCFRYLNPERTRAQVFRDTRRKKGIDYYIDFEANLYDKIDIQ